MGLSATDRSSTLAMKVARMNRFKRCITPSFYHAIPKYIHFSSRIFQSFLISETNNIQYELPERH